MTREETIKILNAILCFSKCDCPKDDIEKCLKMAIEALKQQPNEDCISRKSMLEGLANIAKAKAKSDAQKSLMGRVMFFTEHLPSVTPQPSEHTEERTETHACDCISRKFMHDMGATCIAARNKDGNLVALGALDILPSVNLQPKVGHWIEPQQDDGMSDPIYYQVRCSECNFDLDPQTWSQELHQYGADKYCPRCGCRMQEVKK